MAANESTRFLLRLSIASLVLTAAVAIIAVLADEFDDTTGNVVLTTLAISLYIATGSAGVSVLDRPDLRVAGIATIVASGFALLRRLGAVQEPVPTAAGASAETVVLAAGRLDAEVTLLRADGAELLLASVDLSDGGRLAALRTPREIRVLIERAP